MLDDDACYMLASWAKHFSSIIFEIIRHPPKPLPNDVLCKASQIATRLRVVSSYIDSLPRYWIETNVEQLCRDMLKSLARICLGQEKSRTSPGFGVAYWNLCLAKFSAKNGLHAMTLSIYRFFADAANKKELDDFNQDCRMLHEALAPTGDEEAKTPPSNIWSFSQHDNVNHNKTLFEVVEKHCRCRPSLHELSSNDAIWHPARLFLEDGSSGSGFDILVSSMDMSIWQEFRLSVPSKESKSRVASGILAPDRFCTFLEEQKFARIAFLLEPGMGLYQLPRSEVQKFLPAAGRGDPLANILRQYQLTPRDKILLAFAISRAYWQFYDSGLMRTKWTSETIWFMPTTLNYNSDELPLQAFIHFPFGTSSEPPADFIHDIKIPLNHRCPRIFALGVLLLEIGLAKPFPSLTRPSLVAQTNFDHRTAMNQLEILKNTKWEGFSHMSYFVDAVEYCINGANFIQEYKDSNRSSKRQKDLAARRKDIHDRVVLPLAWLALKGFKRSSKTVTYINKIGGVASPPYIPRPVAQNAPSEGLFHTGRSATPRRWLDNLKGISAYIDSMRARHRMECPVRVTILDTGINTSMPFYRDEDDGDDRSTNVTSWRDFVDPGNSSKLDEFGHGSFMARVVTELIPFAEIIIARVARNTKELSECQDNITKAIQWAGQEGTDIICMSFGFPQDHKGISEAIQQVVSCKNGVVCFASAGNSAYEEESFPARHPDVISMYATDPYGTFAKSNSRRPSNGTDIFGTFGDCIPPYIEREFQEEYRDVCQPGSSVATAVAAGIAAIMLVYIAILPRLVEVSPSDETMRVLRRIHSPRGMAAVFRAMATDMSHGQLFVNPAQFWRSKNKDEARYHAISAILWDIDRGMQ